MIMYKNHQKVAKLSLYNFTHFHTLLLLNFLVSLFLYLDLQGP